MSEEDHVLGRDVAVADEEPDLDAPRRKLVDPRTKPARIHHLKAAGRSGAHALAAFQGDGHETLATRIGALEHALLFGKPWILWDQPSKDGKGKSPRSPKNSNWVEFQAKYPGHVIPNAGELASAMRMVDAIRSHRGACRILFGPDVVHEQTILWRHLGRDRQSTPDVRHPSYLAELKTTRDAAPWAFDLQATKLGYFAQLADQADAIEAHTGRRPREVFVVAVENVPPYVVQVYSVSRDELEKGARERDAWQERLAMYEATGLWGGYAPGVLPLKRREYTPRDVVDDGEPDDAEGAA